MQALEKGSVLKVRYLIKFTKESNIKFISHLDLMRTLQRIVNRAGIPVEYSKGFNPHMNMSIAQPLSVGMYSFGEYMDIQINGILDENYIIKALNNNAPSGIKFKAAKLVPEISDSKKVPQAMALIDAAKYIIRIKYDDIINLKDEIEILLKQEKWETIKKSKSGEKIVDIKELIKDFQYVIEGYELFITCIIACGSRKNLSSELLANYIANNTSSTKKDAFIDINREELYVEKDSNLIPLMDFIK